MELITLITLPLIILFYFFYFFLLFKTLWLSLQCFAWLSLSLGHLNSASTRISVEGSFFLLDQQHDASGKHCEFKTMVMQT